MYSITRKYSQLFHIDYSPNAVIDAFGPQGAITTFSCTMERNAPDVSRHPHKHLIQEVVVWVWLLVLSEDGTR
jgi:hypothetical protein